MIDKLQRIAQSIAFLRTPTIVVGLLCLASIVMIAFTSMSHEGDRFLIPSFIGLLWAMSTYAFIITFRLVPEKANKTLSFFSKLKRNIYRGWYWFIGVVFLSTTMVVISVIFRMVSIWLKDYGG